MILYCCAVIIAVALLTTSWSLLPLVLPLLLYLAQARISYTAKLQDLNDLTASRTVSPFRCYEGEEASIALSIRYEGQNGKLLLDIHDPIPKNTKLVSGSNTATVLIEAAQTVDLKYVIKPERRGHYRLNSTRIRSWEGLGIFEDTVIANCKSEFYVFPRIEVLPLLQPPTKYRGPWRGLVPSKVVGGGYDFYGVRDYLPGDEYRRINWKASARLLELLSNEYESERTTVTLLVVDESVPRLIEGYLDYELRMAASLARMFLQSGNKVGLLLHGAYRSWVYPSFGKRHLIKILENLSSSEVGPSTLSLDYVLDRMASVLIPYRSSIMLISPLIDEEPYKVASNFFGRYKLLYFSPNFQQSFCTTRSSETDLLIKSLNLQKREMARKISNLAQIIEWNPAVPIKHLSLRPKRWRARIPA